MKQSYFKKKLKIWLIVESDFNLQNKIEFDISI